MKASSIKIITKNRKAFHDYFIHDKIEAGIALLGTEVKSIRAGQMNLKDSYAKIIKNEVFLFNTHISKYQHGGMQNHEPERQRKLLLHKREIKKLKRSVKTKSQTIVPLQVYINKEGRIKVEIGLATGKRKYDKRAAIAAKESKRQLDRIRKDSF